MNQMNDDLSWTVEKPVDHVRPTEEPNLRIPAPTNSGTLSPPVEQTLDLAHDTQLPKLRNALLNDPLLARNSSNSVAIDSLLRMRQNLEDQVTILHAKVTSVSNRHSLSQAQLAAVCQSLQGVVQLCSRRLPEQAAVAVLDYLTPIKNVDPQLNELWGLLFYRGTTDADYSGLALARDLPPPPAPPAPACVGPQRQRGAPMRDSQRQKLHATIIFQEFSEASANSVDWDKFIDDVTYGICKFVRIAPSRVWAGDVRRLRNQIELDISFTESDDKSAKTAIQALREVLNAPNEALAGCAYVYGSLKPKSWTASPTGIALDLMAPKANIDSIFFKLGAIHPAPPPSPWSSQPTICLAIFHSTGAYAGSSLTEADFNGEIIGFTIPAASGTRIRAELQSIWRTREGKEVNKELLGSSDWTDQLSGKAITCGDYSIDIECFLGSRP